jgi:two-component system sensor histidine kinase YesM
MKPRRKAFPLSFKLTVLFIGLISIPILIIGSFTYYKYSKNVEQDAQAYTYQLVEQIRLNLDRYFKEVDRLTLAPMYDPEVLSILKKRTGPYSSGVNYVNVEEAQKINLFLSSMEFDRSEIESINIFGLDGSLFNSKEATMLNYWIKEQEQWMKEAELNEGALTILPPHTVYYYAKAPRRVVSLSRLIRDPYTFQTLGVIKVDLTQQGLEKIFSSASFGEGSFLYIQNQTGAFIYPEERQLQHATKREDQYIASSVHSKNTNLTISGYIHKDNLKKEARKLMRFTLYISIIALSSAFLAAIVLSNRQVKPIRHLQSRMALVQKGFFNVQARITSYDEIGELTAGFNKMVNEIKRLLQEVYETRIREREVELSALQSQMNPHFLYNTLETINAMAVKAHALELSGVVSNLGTMLRYTVNNRQTMVWLQDEVTFVESYMQIQEMRLGSRFRSEIYVGASLEHALVPKLILQPLVENAIEHGLAESEEGITVRLTARLEGDDLTLAVEDNGRGMTPEKLQQVMDGMYGRHVEQPDYRAGSNRGYGLRNVHQRIRLLFGESYGVDIRPGEERGVRISIRIPFQWEEKEESNVQNHAG